MIDHERRVSFDRDAAGYDAARPSYPAAFADRLAARAPGRQLVEIGAGTGKATEVLSRAGFAIIAIEPGANLAAALRGKRLANVTIEQTTFEAWHGGEASCDVVLAAQSFHWVAEDVRYPKSAAVLRPGGVLAIVRNEKTLDPALRAELDAADAEAGVSSASGGHDYAAAIAASGRFGPIEASAFPWAARYTTAAYLDLLATSSKHAVLAADVRAQLFAAIARVIDRRGGAIEIAYVTNLVVAPRR
jgi:2-polyprenyl-3-methyl-5-hydroxy-6-metoxy-1,4-benzoquinol methylase